MKKSVVEPLFTTELHPCEAIAFALKVVHPITKDATLDEDLVKAFEELVRDPGAVHDRRAALQAHWQARLDGHFGLAAQTGAGRSWPWAPSSTWCSGGNLWKLLSVLMWT